MSSTSSPPPDLAALRGAAASHVARGAFEEGRIAYEAACAALVTKLGADHVAVAELLEKTAGAARHAGDLYAAHTFLVRARAIYRKNEGCEGSVGSVDSALRLLAPLHDDVLSRRPGLVVVHRASNREYVVRHDIFFMGRGIERVHLYIHSVMLSRVHARIVWRRRLGAFVMHDCGSENGTFYDGKMLSRDVEQPIADGDVFRMGDHEVACRVSARRR